MNTNTVQLADSDIQWCTVYIHSKSPSKKKKPFFFPSAALLVIHIQTKENNLQHITHTGLLLLPFPLFGVAQRQI